MDNEKITITERELIEVSSSILTDDEKKHEILSNNPLLLLLFATHITRVWRELVKIHENDKVENN